MNVLDLFAGLGGWSEAFRARGHSVTTLDIEPRFSVDIVADVLTWDTDSLAMRPDIILASPPCEAFSTMSIGTHWTGGRRAYIPKSDAARLGVQLVKRTVGIILELRPRFFVIENPRDVLRSLEIIPAERRTVWQCHVGRAWAKPTDLWGGFPPSLDLPRECHNRRPDHPDDCCCHDHNAAPRGSRTGTQGPKSAAERAEIPYGLSFLVCEAAERDLQIQSSTPLRNVNVSPEW
jgi:hypothetical protein